MSSRDIHFSDYAKIPQTSAKAIVLPPPAKGGDAFLNEVLKTATSGQVHRNPLEWLGATALHTAIVLALIIIPLYTTEAIHMTNYDSVPLVAPPPPPPPPAVGGAVAPHVTHVHPKMTYDMNKLVAPTKIPKKIATGGASEQQVAPDLDGVAGGVPGGQVGGVLGGVVGGIGGAAPPPPPPAKRAEPQPVKRIVRAGSLLKAPRQTLNVAPEYPPLARETHIRGVVVVDAIIDERGNVVQARAISGHPLLTQSALKAVLQWKYEPTSLNGVPVSVELEVQVHFDLP